MLFRAEGGARREKLRVREQQVISTLGGFRSFGELCVDVRCLCIFLIGREQAKPDCFSGAFRGGPRCRVEVFRHARPPPSRYYPRAHVMAYAIDALENDIQLVHDVGALPPPLPSPNPSRRPRARPQPPPPSHAMGAPKPFADLSPLVPRSPRCRAWTTRAMAWRCTCSTMGRSRSTPCSRTRSARSSPTRAGRSRPPN